MLYKRSFTPPKKESFFLFGPRGTGKTTWLKQTYPHALWIDLLSPHEERELGARPELLLERVDAHPNLTVLVIDEVQKVPKILDVIHGLIEERRGAIQCILTGSSSRKLRRGGVNLLAGRALWKHFHPFIGYELQEEFRLEKAIKTGLIPLIWTSDSPQEKLQNYIDLYLQEEVKAEALVRQVGDFTRFLEAMAHSHGSILNLTNVANDCAVSRKTVDSHLQILQDLLLGYTIPVFEKKAKRAVTAHPKFYFFDPGVFRALRRQGFGDVATEMEGHALEGLIAEHLRCWIDQQIEPSELFFWRTRAGLEVDFIVYGESVFWAIEVKNGTSVCPGDLRSLKEFVRDHPEAKPLFLYRGKERIRKDGILCLPAQDFCVRLNPQACWDEF